MRLATPWRPVWETPAAPSRSGRGPCGVRPVALHSPCGRYAPCTRGARGRGRSAGGGGAWFHRRWLPGAATRRETRRQDRPALRSP